MGQAEPTPTDEPLIVQTTPTEHVTPGRRASHTRLKNLAAVSAIAAVTFAALLIAFSVRLSQVSGDRDRIDSELAATEVELAATADELDVVSSALDDATAQLDDALGQVADVSSSLEATTADAGELGQLVDELTAERDAYEADLRNATSDLSQAINDLTEANAELAFYSAPPSPAEGLVVVDGRWEVTWNESDSGCVGFKSSMNCRAELRLASLTSTSASAGGIAVSGGPSASSSLAFSMSGSESNDFTCNNARTMATRTLTFEVTGADLVGGLVVARTLSGNLDIRLSDGCANSVIFGSFTAVRTD